MNIKFTKEPNRLIWGLVIGLVAIMALIALLVACVPPTPIPVVVTRVVDNEVIEETATPAPTDTPVPTIPADEIGSWNVPRGNVTRIYDKNFGNVCYVFSYQYADTGLNATDEIVSHGGIQCMKVDGR